MNWVEKIKGYYDMKLWDVTRVRNAVIKEKITEEQFKEIVGHDYIA